jgi:hypothetical protein
MTAEYLTIEDLLKGLKGDPNTAKALVAEIIAQFTKEYLTIEEVAKRLSWEERTVKNKMEAGIFQKGVHYFAPKGIRPRFKWQAIVAWLEETETIATEKTAAATDAIPMARGYLSGQQRKKNYSDLLMYQCI